MDAAGTNLPRLLITGFEPFPGAPVNPTAWLVAALRDTPPATRGMGEFRADVLPVDYGAIGPRLAAIGQTFSPDIAIHFGLAQGCNGFRLERIARNRYSSARPDNAGFAPRDGSICTGPLQMASTLPLAEIHDVLERAGLAVEWSDDAGGYLCNAAMTLSLAHACGSFAPAMSGFVHVPPVGPGRALSQEDLLRGVSIILDVTLEAWRSRLLSGPG